MRFYKRLIALAMAFVITLSLFAPAAMAQTDGTGVSSTMQMDLRVNRSKLVLDNAVVGYFKNTEDHAIEQLHVVYEKPSGEQIAVELIHNGDSNYYEFALIPDETGQWNLSYLEMVANGETTQYDGSAFYGGFEVFSSIGEIYPEESLPIIDLSQINEGVSVHAKDLSNLLGQVRAYDENGEFIEVEAIIENDADQMVTSIYSDGLSITSSTDREDLPLTGYYTLTYSAQGKYVSTEIQIVEDEADADFVSVASLPPVEEVVYTSAISAPFRLAGDNRFSTAVAVSKYNYTKSYTAVLVNAFNFPDALAASAYAAAIDSPILYTGKDQIDSRTTTEMSRLGVKNVVVIGGVGAVSGAVVNKLTLQGIHVERINGNDRFATANQIARALKNKSNYSEAIIVNAFSHPDALSAGAYAAKNEIPILYTAPGALDASTLDLLSSMKVTKAIIVGGTERISTNIEKQLSGLSIQSNRIAGQDRYDTSAQFASAYFANASMVVLANGINFPDALAGGPLAGFKDAPILLTPKEAIPTAINSYILSSKAVGAAILGGSESVQDGVVTSVNQSLVANDKRLNTPAISNPDPTPKPDTETVVKVPVQHIPKRTPTASNPIRIVLDPGHGWQYNKGVVEGYYEGIAMYWYAHILKNELIKYGFDVKVTRNDIEGERKYVESKGWTAWNGISLEERGQMANGYDLLLSLHSNAAPWTWTDYQKVRGTEIFDSVTSPRRDLATQLCDMIANHFGHTNRGVKYKELDDGTGRNWYGVLRNSGATHSMLVEHGFHTNPEDGNKLMDREFKMEMARKTAKILADYYGMPAR